MTDTLIIAGKLSASYSNHIKRKILTYPRINRVLINSPGGDVVRAWEISDLLLSKGSFHAHNTGICSGAAMIIFLHGEVRSIDPLGYFDTLIPVQDRERETNIHRQKLAKLFKNFKHGCFLDTNEAMVAGVVHMVEQMY